MNPEQSPYLTFGITLAAGFIVFTYLGYFAGAKLGNSQAWTLGGMFMGLFYCGYETWKLIQKTNKPDKP